ncbi:YfhO family protein [Aureivirga sp. CE67]|uniref:YfhO family protein n=1 Tax=Aureivirga sp. CE67 TaxID=1788983 RepID=UPI0018CA30FC|nr:YfhO family protein [Aureivirga sp. CE67]
MNTKLKNLLPTIIALLVFVIVSLAYFHPVLNGKKLFQSDIQQFQGMAKEINDYRDQYGEEPYWTNSNNLGMPSYQLSTYYPNNYIKKLDSVLRFLPRPADYLFLYFLGFFILLSALKVNYKLAILGALSFGFSTYFIIILGAGHNAKAHAIAYMPMVLAGILLVFRNKYFLGFVLTALAMALELNVNHPQMSYYLMWMVLIMGLFYLIDAFKNNKLPNFAKQIGILIPAVILAIGVNATSILASKEYKSFSTRGKSELTIDSEGKPVEAREGLSKKYITQFSYGKLETMDLFIPRFMGGGVRENIGEDSNTFEFLRNNGYNHRQAKEFVSSAPTYWGDQPIVEAPAYVGAVMIFLFVLGIFIIDGKIKYWLVATSIFSLILSWGKNFGIVTDFFIDYVPFYNIFRAVSSIQVILELAVPLLGILALKEMFSDNLTKERKQKAILYSLYITGGIALFFTLFGTSFFAFEGIIDQGFPPDFKDVLISDRKSIFFEDSLRTLILVVISAGTLWFFNKEKIGKGIVYVVFFAVILFDLIGVDSRYVNSDDFVPARQVNKPYQASPIDKEILKDKSHYRVANFLLNPMNDGSTSYFHKSIGGYHAAKPGRYQELYDFHIAKKNLQVLNMINTKYFIDVDQERRPQIQINEEANGNAWFVDKVDFVKNANEEILALSNFDSKTTAIVDERFKKDLEGIQIMKDSTATISLTNYKANELTYESNTTKPQVAIFSEAYYKNGWNAYVDGQKTPIFRADYVLRGIVVPAGKHKVEFKFEPQVIKTGNTITLISYALLILIPLGWYFVEKKKKTN